MGVFGDDKFFGGIYFHQNWILLTKWRHHSPPKSPHGSTPGLGHKISKKMILNSIIWKFVYGGFRGWKIQWWYLFSSKLDISGQMTSSFSPKDLINWLRFHNFPLLKLKIDVQIKLKAHLLYLNKLVRPYD